MGPGAGGRGQVGPWSPKSQPPHATGYIPDMRTGTEILPDGSSVTRAFPNWPSEEGSYIIRKMPAPGADIPQYGKGYIPSYPEGRTWEPIPKPIKPPANPPPQPNTVGVRLRQLLGMR